MRVFNKQIATNVLLNANYNSNAVPLKSIFMYSIAALTSNGTLVGTIKLQASNDPETNDSMPLGTPAPPPTHWVDITGSSFTLFPATNETMWNVRDVAYNYVRVVFTDNSGGTNTATMSIIVNAKGV